MAGTLTLFAAAHHKLVQIGGAVVHRLHGDDGNRTVAVEDSRETAERSQVRRLSREVPCNYKDGPLCVMSTLGL